MNNTGQASFDEVLKGWKESPGHNKNLLLSDGRSNSGPDPRETAAHLSTALRHQLGRGQQRLAASSADVAGSWLCHKRLAAARAGFPPAASANHGSTEQQRY